VDEYRKGAENALAAGFDGVEIHGANGYLIDQFLRDGSNHRTGQYGGSLENRTRFLLEVVEAVTGVWGRHQVGVRISPKNPFNDMSDSDPQALFTHVAEALSEKGLAYLHVVEGSTPGDEQFDYAGLKEAFNGPYIANGGYDRKRTDAVLAEGRADLVSFGVLSLANPDLPERLFKGGPFNEPHQDTFYGGGAEGYTDYPFLG
jgi:N-ethylmaleimide reductase